MQRFVSCAAHIKTAYLVGNNSAGGAVILYSRSSKKGSAAPAGHRDSVFRVRYYLSRMSTKT